jgi:radical SAM-linked protein
MTFALPVALGVESDCESVDLRLTEEMDFDKLLGRVQAVLPPGYSALSVAAPVMDPGQIAWADYTVNLTDETLPGEELKAKLEEFLALPAIETKKKSKKGIVTVDLKPHAQVLSLTANGRGAELQLRLAAGNTMNISPVLFLGAYSAWAGREPDLAGIRRTAILTADLADFA